MRQVGLVAVMAQMVSCLDLGFQYGGGEGGCHVLVSCLDESLH